MLWNMLILFLLAKVNKSLLSWHSGGFHCWACVCLTVREIVKFLHSRNTHNGPFHCTQGLPEGDEIFCLEFQGSTKPSNIPTTLFVGFHEQTCLTPNWLYFSDACEDESPFAKWAHIPGKKILRNVQMRWTRLVVRETRPSLVDVHCPLICLVIIQKDTIYPFSLTTVTLIIFLVPKK